MTCYQTHNWEEELPKIKELGSLGWRMPAIGHFYGVSRQRIKQIIKKYIPEWNMKYGAIVNRDKRAAIYKAKWGDKQNTDLYKAQRVKFASKKYNAIRTGYEWNITFGELEWPEYCPILGIKINYFSETRGEDSPSFYRIDNTIGYNAGNVQVISWRANRIKNDGTAEEHRQIANYLDKLRNATVDSQDPQMVQY